MALTQLSFDAEYYATHRPDVFAAFVAQAASTPTLVWAEFAQNHYNTYGRFEGSNPNAVFNTNEYLLANPDVAGSGMNPFDHYLTYGLNEGRAPSASFVTLAEFDWETYVNANPDLGAAGIDTAGEAYAHYVMYGQFEDRPGTPVAPEVPDFNLTIGADNITGTNADEIFQADLGFNLNTDAQLQTLTGVDRLEGGGGTDKLIAELDGSGGTQNPIISGIEIYEFTSHGAANLDLARATGYQEIHNLNSWNDLVLNNLTEVPDLVRISNVRANTEINFDGVEIDELNLELDRFHEPSGQLDVKIGGNTGDIGVLNLEVSGGVNVLLDGNADQAVEVNISGSGDLAIEGTGNFGVLEKLDATGYNEDLFIDVSGSAVLEDVQTGDGDDTVVVNKAAVNGGLAVDLGAGENELVIDGALTEADISALDFTGGVAGAQTLALGDVTLAADATLDFDGFDVPPADLEVGVVTGAGNVLALANAAEELTVTADSIDDLGLDTGNVVDLTVETFGNANISSLNAPALETLALSATDPVGANATLDVDSNADHDLSVLTSVDVTATGDATVDINADDADADVDALTSVGVTAGAAGTAALTLTGQAGEPGTVQVQTLTFTGPATAAGNVSLQIPGVGTFNVAYANADTAAAIAGAVALFLDSGFAAFGAFAAGDDVIITGNDAGVIAEIVAATTNGTGAAVTSDLTTPGVDLEPGIGFAGLTDATVEGANANVNLTDVYGAFALVANASAGDAAVDLINTGVTSATITASNMVTFNIIGDTIGAADLTALTVTAGAGGVAASQLVNAGAAVVNVTSAADVLLTVEASEVTDVTVTAEGNAGVTFLNNEGAATVLVEADDDADVDIDGGGVVSATVNAGNDARVDVGAVADAVDLEDLTVTAGNDANVNITGGGVVTATVSAGLDSTLAGLDATVNVTDAVDLTTLTVSAADDATVTLTGTLDSFTTLDISGVVGTVTVDASLAVYGGVVEYEIGASEIVNFTTDVANATHEVFTFGGADIGIVTIDGFFSDLTATDGDRDQIDLSAFGITNPIAQLTFGDNGGDLEITSSLFTGSITVVGVLPADGIAFANAHIV